MAAPQQSELPMISTAGLSAPRRAIFCSDALVGKTILVTGASSGLGRAAAFGLAQVGARLIVMGRDTQRLNATLTMLREGEHHAIAGAMDDADAAAILVREAAAVHGPFDGIFHSAGVYRAQPAKTTRQKIIEEIFAAAVWGAYGVARAAAQRAVLHNGGAVIFMTSVAAERGHPGTIAYAGAKATIAGLVRSLAVELGGKRIRVNGIVSGTIETEMHLATVATLPDHLVEEGRGNHILGFGRVDDIANMVTYLMSDAGQWITGAMLHVDGGYTAS